MSSSCLIIEETGARFDLTPQRALTIGRVPPNDIVLNQDLRVSRNHAMVRALGDGRFYLMDVGSANGTFVNGRRVLVPHMLDDGDKMVIGSTSMAFQAGEATIDYDAPGAPIQATIVSSATSIQDITVLVADVRGYTRLSESIDVDRLANVMGAWFRQVGETITRNKGEVDKFIGDAVMACWYPDQSGVRGEVSDALRAARDMARAAEAMNTNFPGLPFPFRIGVGINTGKAAIGTIGSIRKREYTALGDAVNVAFRLETASKELGCDVVLGPDSAESLPIAPEAVHAREIMVKGKAQPLQVYAFQFAELDPLLA